MRRLRVGVIGFGVGEQHLKSFQEQSDCRVTTLCDLSSEKLLEARKKYPDVRVTRNEDDVLLSPDIDVVSIASYDDHHAQQIIKALQTSKHVFVEKPLCQTLEELQNIKQAWLQCKGTLKLASNLILRTTPLYRWLKRKLEAGKLGEIYAFDGDYLYGRLEKIIHGWRKEVKDYSVIEGGGIHLIDLMTWISGQRPRLVSTHGNRICTKGSSFRYKDYVALTLEFPSGLLARITANFGCVHKHKHVVRVFGTRATFISDDSGARWHSSRNSKSSGTAIPEAALPNSKGELIPFFVKAIRNNNPLNNETQTHFDVMSICIAAEKALQSRQREEIVYI